METTTMRPEPHHAAVDFADDPFEALGTPGFEIETALANEAAERAARLRMQVRSLAAEIDPRTGCPRVVGASAQFREVLEQAARVAPTATTVLLLGESGTGKEVLARFIHRASSRDRGPF